MQPLEAQDSDVGGTSIQAQLLSLALALALPFIIFFGLLLLQFTLSERSRLQTGALENVRNIALAVDRELSGVSAALNVLALSTRLQGGDLEGFYRQAAEVRSRLGFWTILRESGSGQQLLNTRVPWGSTLPRSAPVDASDDQLESTRPIVSGLVIGAVSKAAVVMVEIPVEVGGKPGYMLGIPVPVDTIRDVLVSETPSGGWISSVVDGAGKIIARNTRHEEFAGQSASADYLANAHGQENSWYGTTVDGQSVFSAFSRSRLSDWRVGLALPEADLNAPVYRSIQWFVGLGAALVGIAALLALILARRIAGPIEILSDRALALGRGEAVAPLSTGLREANQVGQTLAAVGASLSQRNADLRRSETRYRLVVENATDYAIITMDLHGVVTGWNTGAENVLGWRQVEMIGGRFEQIFTPEDRSAGIPEAEMGAALAKGRAPDERWHIRKDGSRFFATGALMPKRDETGALLGFLKILRDRTVERQADEALHSLNQILETRVAERTQELAAANERLVAEASQRQEAEEQLRQAQKMEALGRLTGGVAHDFNNLLTVVTGSLDMLRRRVDNSSDARVQRLIDQALQGANRAAALTYRLLAFSRQQPLAPEPVDANKLVAGMSDMLGRTLGEHIAVETVLAGGLWRTHADPNQLENALLNLAVNARDAMPDGGKLTIETANAHLDETYAATRQEVTPGQYVLIAVCDTGLGMTPEVMARVFEPFFTTKPVGKGTGLGLSQVYGFVKQSGGHVAVYSEPRHGTTVKLYLPRFRQSAEAAQVRGAKLRRPDVNIVKARRGETILVVEDEAMVRDFSVSALEEAGYRVLAAEDGPSGLALLDANPEVALLFTDVVLTGPMNGRKVADEALRRRPDLRVLFTTGYTRNAIIHHGRLDEGVELLGKPFTTADLAAKIGKLLEGDEILPPGHSR